jgi:glycosyltransferase involved in cell wall biosynthesis
VQTSARDLQRSCWWISSKNRRWLGKILRRRSSKEALSPQRPDASLFWAPHLADYLRFYVLYKFGGTYVDTDAIFLQELPKDVRDIFALDVSPTEAHPWFVNSSARTYVAPGIIRCARSSPVMRSALEVEFDVDRYDPACFNCAGPRALNMALLKYRFQVSGSQGGIFPGKSTPPTYLPPRYFYPLPYDRAYLMFQAGKPMIPLYLQHAQRYSYAIHLYGHVSRRLVSTPESGAARLAERQNLMPATSERDGPLMTPRLIVVRGETTRLAGPHAVFFRGLDERNSEKAPATFSWVQIGAKYGSIRPCATCQSKQSTSLHADVHDIRTINAFLSSCIYVAPPNTEHATDVLTVAVTGSHGGKMRAERELNVQTWVDSIPIAIFNRLVTVVTHTHGRKDKVLELHESVQSWFPGTRVLASDDTNATLPVRGSRFIRWIRLPFDSGLSVARNTLVGMATTQYVQLLDDDFVLDERSHLDLLLERLVLHPEVGIAGSVVPEDLAMGWKFQGLMEAREKTLTLSSGSRGYFDGCARVDYVPNVFMAQKAAILGIGGWDPELKLGEHEEFFWRIKARKAFAILSCKFVGVRHRQFRWWEAKLQGTDATSTRYVESRSRIYKFYAAALAKHNFQELIIDGRRIPIGSVLN